MNNIPTSAMIFSNGLDMSKDSLNRLFDSGKFKADNNSLFLENIFSPSKDSDFMLLNINPLDAFLIITSLNKYDFDGCISLVNDKANFIIDNDDDILVTQYCLSTLNGIESYSFELWLNTDKTYCIVSGPTEVYFLNKGLKTHVYLRAEDELNLKEIFNSFESTNDEKPSYEDMLDRFKNSSVNVIIERNSDGDFSFVFCDVRCVNAGEEHNIEEIKPEDNIYN